MTSIDRSHNTNDQGHDEDSGDPYDPSLPPLDRRILDIVKSCPNRTIRPAKLTTELGISVNDACAELCGLMSAVGGGADGATFVFDTSDKNSGAQPTMVFTFPPDFEQRALRHQRKEDWYKFIQHILRVMFKIVKVITAFGLILSLLIICIAVILSIIAVIIGMSRTGGHNTDHQRSQLIHKLRSVFFTMRQLLWFYAVFGDNIEGQDPFLREIAYDLSLVMSICCGNPGSFFFWYRTNLLSRRRQRYTRGWGGRGGNYNGDMEGVSLIHRGTWDHSSDRDNDNDRSSGAATTGPEEHRGIVSIAVEFLFGPIPFYLGPDEAEKWKMRGAVIMNLSSNSTNDGSSISLDDLGPYIDYPNKDRISGELAIISHFNGVPATRTDDNNDPSENSPRFVFPELLAESSISMKYTTPPNMDDGSWASLLYAKDFVAFSGRSYENDNTIPPYLTERRYVLTRLQRNQFIHCAVLGALNFIGVIWMNESLQPGGALADIVRVGFLFHFTKDILLPVLSFYSYLFWALVAGRFLVVVILNKAIVQRNKMRSEFADTLQQQSSS